MNLSINVNVPVITVFMQGLLSFFSPCVLPLLPIYMGYLSGGTVTKGEDGKTHYDRKKVMLNTVFFVVGVSFAFFWELTVVVLFAEVPPSFAIILLAEAAVC